MTGESDPRFRRWLAARAPERAPAGLLARSLTALDGMPAQQWRWRWPRLSLAIGSAGVAVVAIAALLVAALGLHPPVLPPIGNASESPTVVVSASPGTQPTDGPWPSESGSPEPGASETPGASEPAESVLPPNPPAPTTRPVYDHEPLTVVTFRLILDSVPADTVSFRLGVSGISTPPYVQGLDDYNGAVFCGAADRPAPCVPGTYERRATFPAEDVSALEWFLSRFTPSTSSANPPLLVSHGFVPSDALVVVRFPAPVAGPSQTPAAGFSCADPVGQSVGIEMRSWEPSYVSAENICVIRIDVQSSDPPPTAGTIIVTVDGSVAWTMDLALWDSTGTQGTLPTYRIIVVDPSFAVAKGHVLGLTFSGCDDTCASTLDVFVMGRQP